MTEGRHNSEHAVPRSTREQEAAPSEAHPLRLLDLLSILRKHLPLILGLVCLFTVNAGILHWKFPPRVQSGVYLKLGEEWARALQSPDQSLDEAVRENRLKLERQLIREGTISRKFRPPETKTSSGASADKTEREPPLIEFDLTHASLSRCELSDIELRQVRLIAEGRSPEEVVDFLLKVTDAVVERHHQICEQARRRWTEKRDRSSHELERLETVRKNISAVEPQGDRETALKSTTVDLLDKMQRLQEEERSKSSDLLKRNPDSLTVRTGPPEILGPVGARTWPLVLVLGAFAGGLAGIFVALLLEIRAIRDQIQPVADSSPENPPPKDLATKNPSPAKNPPTKNESPKSTS